MAVWSSWARPRRSSTRRATPTRGRCSTRISASTPSRCLSARPWRHERERCSQSPASPSAFDAAAGASPRSTMSPSRSTPAKRWRWSAPPAAASRRSRALLLRLIEPDAGTRPLRRRVICWRCAGAALRARRATAADGVPGSACRLQPARHGGARARRSAAHPRHRAAQRAPAPHRRLAGARRPDRRPRPARHPRDLRRPAPARRHRPRHRHAPVADRARRGGVGARRLGARTDPASCCSTCSGRKASPICSSRTISAWCAPSPTASPSWTPDASSRAAMPEP